MSERFDAARQGVIQFQRDAVIAETKSWIGTPWHHQARVKGAGVDCANHVIASYYNPGLIIDIQPGNYERDWHIHKNEERFLTFVPSFAVEIPKEKALPGDLILFRIGRVFSHGAVLVATDQICHAWIRAHMVVLGDLERESSLMNCERKYFTHKAWV